MIANYARPSVTRTFSSIGRPNTTRTISRLSLMSSTYFSKWFNLTDCHMRIEMLTSPTSWRCQTLLRWIMLQTTPLDCVQGKIMVKSLPAGSITTCDELADKFLTRYFPLRRPVKLRNKIFLSQKADGESLYVAWERWKDLIRQCTHHRLELGLQTQAFTLGLISELSS